MSVTLSGCCVHKFSKGKRTRKHFRKQQLYLSLSSFEFFFLSLEKHLALPYLGIWRQPGLEE